MINVDTNKCPSIWAWLVGFVLLVGLLSLLYLLSAFWPPGVPKASPSPATGASPAVVSATAARPSPSTREAGRHRTPAKTPPSKRVAVSSGHPPTASTQVTPPQSPCDQATPSPPPEDTDIASTVKLLGGSRRCVPIGGLAVRGWDIEQVPTDVRLLWVVAIAAAIGSLVRAARAMNLDVSKGQLTCRTFFSYGMYFPVGIAMAVLFYLGVRGGFFANAQNGAAAYVDAFGVAALGGLVGLFSDQAFTKMENIFAEIFRNRETPSDTATTKATPEPQGKPPSDEPS